jgi:uncharacterized protein YqeY
MPRLFDQITRDIADAMKRRDAATLAPLRMLKAAFMNREVEKGRTLDEAEERQVVTALVKQRRDSIEQFQAGGRQDLVDRERAEVTVLERYLPPGATPGAIEAAIAEAIAETGATGPKDLGRVMKLTMAKLADQTVDGRALSEAVRARLSR